MGDGLATPFTAFGARYIVLRHAGPAENCDVHDLTPCEREVLELLLHGMTDDAIANARGVARSTVGKQLSSIYRKTGAPGRVAVFRSFGGCR